MRRCFIENDCLIDEFDKLEFEKYTGLNWEKDMHIEVTDASENKIAVFNAIMASKEIWVSTSYIGSSGLLLVEMIGVCLLKGIKNKKIINLHEWTDVMWHIPEEIRKYKSDLLKSKIKFIYKEDLHEK